MRRLSDCTHALVCQVLMPSDALGPLRGYHSQVIAKIGESGEVAAILYLMWPLVESKETGNIAADSIAQLLVAASPDDLLELEEDIRWKSSWDLPVGWSQLTVQNAPPFRSKFESQAAALGLLSWHPSGRVREYACRELATLQESSVPAFLLPRMNDWVEPVRRIARTALEYRIDAGRCGDLFGHLYLVVRLLSCQREDHRPFVKLVMDELTAPHQRNALATALNSPIKSVRRTCFRLAIEMEGDHRPAMIRDCSQCEDPVLRLWAARRAREVLPHAELDVAMRTMRDDPLMSVRREALLAVMEHFPDRAVAELTKALLEQSVSMRDFARFYLRKLGTPASPEFYRKALAARRHVTIAIAGIGETGSTSDAEILLPFLTDPSAKRRAAATRSLGALARKGYVTTFLGMLRDSSKKVSDEALRMLRENAAELDFSELWKVFQSPHRHVRRAVLDIMGEFSIWSTKPHLIEAATHVDAETSEHARQIILRNRNRVFTKPDAEQRQAIDARLSQAVHMNPKFVDECRLFLVLLSKPA